MDIGYEFLGDYSNAVSCYRSAGMWQEALFSASQVPFLQDELDELSSSLAEALLDAKEYIEAATIHVEYRNDVAEAARVLCKGCYISEAMRLVCAIHCISLSL